MSTYPHDSWLKSLPVPRVGDGTVCTTGGWNAVHDRASQCSMSDDEVSYLPVLTVVRDGSLSPRGWVTNSLVRIEVAKPGRGCLRFNAIHADGCIRDIAMQFDALKLLVLRVPLRDSSQRRLIDERRFNDVSGWDASAPRSRRRVHDARAERFPTSRLDSSAAPWFCGIDGRSCWPIKT